MHRDFRGLDVHKPRCLLVLSSDLNFNWLTKGFVPFFDPFIHLKQPEMDLEMDQNHLSEF